MLGQLRSIAASGLSPTALSNYIRNPIGFYKKTILKIEDPMEVEETIAANTFGTIVHDALEELYLPFVGAFLDSENLKALKPRIETTVRKHFSKTYSGTSILSGNNLIAYHVVVQYLRNFIDMEIAEANNHRIKIIALEEKVQLQLRIPEIDFPVVLKGKLDRIDEKDGELRIIDYKTGNARRSEVEVIDWHEITTDYEHSKAFQLLCYALMYTAKNPIQNILAGIVSFKNLKAGLLPFGTKEKKGSRNRNTNISETTIAQFQGTTIYPY